MKGCIFIVFIVANPSRQQPLWGYSIIKKRLLQRSERIIRAATLQKCGSEIFSVFLCQRCLVKFGVKFLVKFSVLRFPGFGCATENFSKNFTSKTKKKGNFTLLGRSAENYFRTNSRVNFAGVSVDFWCLFPWKKRKRKIHPRNPQQS